MKTFQQQFEELENIVRTFESGDVDLDVGLKEFEKGMKLAGELKKKLDGAEVKLETLKKEYIKS
ncbi:exodeoxyribonuclease VII small subunit [Candidatus Uhrbacteria bacterium]|nr:exodeoxyribonuclease VII small subunit [Candidatus Uhrbacteria bacterium]